MQRVSAFMKILIIGLVGMLSASDALSNTGSVTDLSKWDVSSYQVNLSDYRGGSGDVQADAKSGWIYLGANHLEGGDVKYEVQVGRLNSADIVEVWVDGYSTTNELNIGPSIFIGAGKNRSEQMTRLSGDAWRPFVFRFADDGMYGDVTDPSNRNEYWRTRYPSSKYELRRIDKTPREIVENDLLPIQISMTGSEDFIIKRIEVVLWRTKAPVVADYREPEYVYPTWKVASKPKPKPTPKILSPAEECAPTGLPPIPQAPPMAYAPPMTYAPPTYITPQYLAPTYLAPTSAPPPTRDAPRELGRGYTIQIAAFRTQAAAMAVREKLRRNSYDAYIVESVEAGQRLFRVRVGRYADKSFALRDADRLRQGGFDTWITELT